MSPLRSRRSLGPVSVGMLQDKGPWEHIGTVALGAASGTAASFQGIDPAYKIFRVSLFAVTTTSGAVAPGVRLNNDSGANYDVQYVDATSTTVAAARSTGQAFVDLTLGGGGMAANSWGVFTATIAKPLAAQPALLVGAQGSRITIITEVTSAVWNNTADLINRIDVLTPSNTLDTQTRTVLEGIRIA